MRSSIPPLIILIISKGFLKNFNRISSPNTGIKNTPVLLILIEISRRMQLKMKHLLSRRKRIALRVKKQYKAYV